MRLDAWLARRPEAGSRGRARTWLERGKVFLNGDPAAVPDAGRSLREGDRVGLWLDRPGSSRPRKREITSARLSLKVLLEDKTLLVADKPPGLLVEPLPGEESGEVTLLDLVVDHLRSAVGVRPFVVHRIDRDTSGLVLFALTRQAQETLKAQFERHSPSRIYTTVVRGRVEPSFGTWQDRLAWDKQRLVQKRAHPDEAAGKDALARYTVVEQFAHHALVEVTLVTGKRNQIRAQAGSRGHPLVGERIYTYRAAPPPPGEPTMARQALHASRLSFVHPATGRRITVDAPLPKDMKGLIASLRGRQVRR
jgi:23S rRNA pseudouridine1911/1915/1917 synthase